MSLNLLTACNTFCITFEYSFDKFLKNQVWKEALMKRKSKIKYQNFSSFLKKGS